VDEIALPEGIYDLGKSFWLRASLTGGGGCPSSNYTLAFALKLRKSTGNVSQGACTSRCVDLAAFLGAASTGQKSVSPPRLHMNDFNLPLVGIGAFQVDEIRGFQHHRTSSQSS
jgi:hypothetical protein